MIRSFPSSQPAARIWPSREKDIVTRLRVKRHAFTQLPVIRIEQLHAVIGGDYGK
jgi:hypothetical protein